MSNDAEPTLPVKPSDAQNAQAPACLPGEKPMTAGRRVHNEITYRGVDFLLNSIIGVTFAYWTARTKSGAKIFGEPVSNFFKAILSPVLKTERSLNEGAKWGSLFTSIIVGGTTIIPPMVYLENKHNKRRFIRWIDEQVYGKEEVATNPRFEQCYTDVDQEPKKNFTTGMVARLLVLAPMIAVTMLPEANKLMVKYLYNPIASLSKGTANALGIKPKALMTRGVMEHAEGDLSKPKTFLSDWDFIHRTVGFDFGLCFIYSYAHEATYKALAALGMKKTEEPEPTTAPPAAALPAADTSDAATTSSEAPKDEKSFAEKYAARKAEKPEPRANAEKPVPASHFTDYATRSPDIEQGAAI